MTRWFFIINIIFCIISYTNASICDIYELYECNVGLNFGDQIAYDSKYNDAIFSKNKTLTKQEKSINENKLIKFVYFRIGKKIFRESKLFSANCIYSVYKEGIETGPNKLNMYQGSYFLIKLREKCKNIDTWCIFIEWNFDIFRLENSNFLKSPRIKIFPLEPISEGLFVSDGFEVYSTLNKINLHTPYHFNKLIFN